VNEETHEDVESWGVFGETRDDIAAGYFINGVPLTNVAVIIGME